MPSYVCLHTEHAISDTGRLGRHFNGPDPAGYWEPCTAPAAASSAPTPTVWLAIRHDGDTQTIQACATVESARNWLARHGIEDEEWATFYDALVKSDDADGVSASREEMTDEQILTVWAGDPTGTDQTVIYGDSDYGMEILASPLYIAPQS